MSVNNLFERYLLALRKSPVDEKTELTDRAALQDLLQALAEESSKEIAVRHEPKRATGKGAPDYKITRGPLILGYVENKGIGENLDKVLKSEQIAKYKSLSQNIVLTDYLHFIWINKDGPPQREALCHATDLENPKFRPHEGRVAAVVKLLQGFFSTAPEGIGRAQQLALALATRSQLLRDYLGEELVRQEREHKEARLYGLFQVFRDQVFHELTLKEFADAFAQMLAYGLFLARLNSDAEMVTLHNARKYVPGSFRLIRELVDFLTELEKAEYREVRWVVEEVLSIVNTLDLGAIHEDLSFKSRKAINRKVRAKDEEEWRLFSRDPFVYFYEDYLAKYDAKMKKARGVYYTPPPIVNFIVRAIDDILKETFGIKAGLADHKRVTVLDFACGTGTFLVEVLERIFENIGEGSGKRNLIVRDHILKNIFGFEYLIAPYTIAHLKLSQYLSEAPRKYELKDDERFQIFLTNTLEPIEPQQNYLLPALTEEVRAAQTVKEQPILVITGNPPYSGHSKNKGAWITAAIDEYKYTLEKSADGHIERKPLGEKNPKWLQDDYVKFIRFAQMKMDAVSEGVVGIITNHSYLNNPTFRGMRQSLMRTFDQIWLLDLHGSSKPKEIPPDGGIDENVFDIMKGVAIGLFIKRPGADKGVWHADLWGKRIEKYKAAAEADKATITSTRIAPVSPFYLFVPQNREAWAEYERGKSVTEIFAINVLGFQTHRDHFAIAFQRDQIERRACDLGDGKINLESFRERYGVKDNRDWKLMEARIGIQSAASSSKKIIQCSYRPFDKRWCYFGNEFMDYPRRELIDHVAARDNLSLLVPRQIGTEQWQHAFVADAPANDCLVSDRTREANQVFPLFLFAPRDGREISKADLFDSDPFTGRDRIENFSPKFRAWIDERYSHSFAPEQVFGFIYAVLFAPMYRTTYAEFTHIDFPRIPFPGKCANFEMLAKLGWELVQKHLLRDVPAFGLGKYRGQGDHEVEKPRYVAAEQAVYVNATQHFAPVPPVVWNFHIGGYQVIDKYLKSRKGRKLTLDEIDNVTNVANVLAFTIEQMRKIDDAYRAAFGD